MADPEHGDGTATRRRKAGAPGALIVGARIVVGVVGVGVAALAVAAATWLPLPTVGGDTRAVTVTPVPLVQERICAGALLRLGDEVGQNATVPMSLGAADIRFAASEGTPRIAPLETTNNAVGVAPQRITVDPGDGPLPLLAGSQSESIARGGLVGFAAAQCEQPVADSWLVGGSTTTGRTTLLSLSNPSNLVATVDLEIYTEAGQAPTGATEGLVVPPNGQRVVSLAAFVPDAVAPVVHVKSRGGQVVAHLQQSVTRTLAPGGVDIIGVSTAPSRHSVIPGYRLASAELRDALGVGSGFEDLAPVIRILVPGTNDATAQLTVLAEDGSTAAAPPGMTVPAGSVVELQLDGTAEGSFTIIVDTDQPAVVAARSSIADEAGNTDFAWFAAAPELRGSALVSVAPGPAPVLHLVNTASAAANVSIAARSGASTSTSVMIPAGAALAVPVADGTSYELTGFDTLRAAVSYQGASQLAAFTVSGPSPMASAVRVYR